MDVVSELRIKRVIAYDIFYDWMDTIFQKIEPIARLVRTLLKVRAARGYFNYG